MTNLVSASGTFQLGEHSLNRLGFGAMQLTGPGIWGDPKDPEECVRVLQRAVELGVNLIDTADAYGPFVSEMLIKRALHPYPDGLVIATKAGLTRHGPGAWVPCGQPAYLRQQCELSLRHLGLERIELFQLHRIDRGVPIADQLGVLAALQHEGKIGHIGLSNVTVEQLRECQQHVTIATVQNFYNLGDRSSDDVLDACAADSIGFIPYCPLATGRLAGAGGALDQLADELDAAPAQLALAWLLKRSEVMLPIPGTSSVAHLEENLGAAEVELTAEQFEALSAVTR